MIQPLGGSLRTTFAVNDDAEAVEATFLRDQLALLVWKRGAVDRWDLSQWLAGDPMVLRSRIVAATGAEYDHGARQLRVLTAAEWKARSRNVGRPAGRHGLAISSAHPAPPQASVTTE